MQNNIKIEIVYATAHQQTIMQLILPANSSIFDAIGHSKLIAEPIDNLSVGIFGRLRSMATVLEEGDRVEIYRPLFLDPKDARVERVKRDRKAKKQL